MTRHISVATALAMSFLLAGCGTKSPAAPSDNQSATGSAAVISGSVRAGTPLLAASDGGSISGLVVSIVGTSLSSGIDAAGRFTLSGVPAGDVELNFRAPGLDATIRLSRVQPAETVSLSVNVEGTSVVVESEIRSAGSQEQLEGRIESLPPTMSTGALMVAGRTVRTDANTRIDQGGAPRSFADLKIGMRVHVAGARSGNEMLASAIRIQNTNTWVPVPVNGVIDSFAGTRSLFQFKIGSRLVKGDDLTEFFGGSTFEMLKDSVRVEVKGQQRDGYIYAERIHVNGADDEDDDEEDDGGQEHSASIEGKLTSMTGSQPALTLVVAGTTVRTSSQTVVQRRGDVQSLEALRIGQTLHVVGTRQSDGSLDARRIQIKDDEPGGVAEIEGPVGGLKGTCPAVSFGVNGLNVTTSGGTTFQGVSCAELRNGTKVLVRGTRQSNGSIAATLVRK